MTRRYNSISALGAFVIWGGWAFWINHSSGMTQALRSGLTQGVASLLITLAMVRLVASLCARFSYPLRLWLAPLLTVALTGTGLVCLHWLARTPHILSTIALPLTVAFSFCLFTAYQLERQRQA
ncbi:MAG: hypothetical protein LBF16_10025 [Pseudomonadales bacterium]|jgi:hypothetical protein|nr:hypothetical protein [Pseudomonadales bacterium]